MWPKKEEKVDDLGTGAGGGRGRRGRERPAPQEALTSVHSHHLGNQVPL